jgi:dockerin type I repeat protein
MKGMIGDINGDGKVTVEDLRILKQVLEDTRGNPEMLLLKFSPDQLAVLDVNQDGMIDEADIEALQHLILQHEHLQHERLEDAKAAS